MGKVRFNVSLSLDGYMAGPDQSEENPLGVGGMDLHRWLFDMEGWRSSHGESGGRVDASTPVVKELGAGFGAVVMGRNMFGPIRGEWGPDPWRGWWGEDPPYHTPVFVVTHFGRESLEMEGGTTFHFVTEGAESAMAQAISAAGDNDVLIAGGASVIRTYMAAGFIDEFWLSIVPLLLGAGERPFEGISSETSVAVVDVIAAPQATHIKYVVR